MHPLSQDAARLRQAVEADATHVETRLTSAADCRSNEVLVREVRSAGGGIGTVTAMGQIVVSCERRFRVAPL